MIIEQLGYLAEDEDLTTASTEAVGYVLDIEEAKADIGVGDKIWVIVKCTTTGSSGSSDGTYQFHLRMGTGTDGTDIDAGEIDVLSTQVFAEGDAEATAGGFLARFAVPIEANLQYAQVWKTLGGTAPTISVDVALSPSTPPSDYNRQTHPASPMSPP